MAIKTAPPMLTSFHKKNRVAWAKCHINDIWNKIVLQIKLLFSFFRTQLNVGIKVQSQLVQYLKTDARFLHGVDSAGKGGLLFSVLDR